MVFMIGDVSAGIFNSFFSTSSFAYRIFVNHLYRVKCTENSLYAGYSDENTSVNCVCNTYM